MKALDKVKKLVLGGGKNVKDPRIFHRLSLVAFVAWVGLGADGLSSSNYGPQKAFLSLGDHRHLAIYLALGIVGVVVTAWAVWAGFGRLRQAVWINHRYRFTTWRWGKGLVAVLVFGAVIKLALL